MSTSPHKPRITQLLRHNTGPPKHSTAAVDAEYKPFASRLNHTTATKQSLENAYKKQYSCPTGGVSKPQNADSKHQVAAYVLQPDGTMAAVRWDDKSALELNRPVLSALKQEQQAQMCGQTTGRIQNTYNSKATLDPDMLHWLASDDDTLSGQSGSGKASERVGSPMGYQCADSYRGWRTPVDSLSPPIRSSRSSDQLQNSGSLTNPQKPCRGQGNASKHSLKVLSSSTISQQQRSYSSSCVNAVSSANIVTMPSHQPTNVRQSSSPLHSTNSAQVQESYWSPQLPHTKSQAVSDSRQTSSQQRQLSIERVPRRHPVPVARSGATPNKETSVWDYFKGYDRCATSDF